MDLELLYLCAFNFSCFPVMDKYNFPWPDRFDCDRLPAVSTDEQLCMDPQEQQGQAPEEGSHMLNKVAGDMGGIFGDRGVNRQGGGGGGVIAIEEQELKDYPKQRGRGEKQQCSCKKCQNG